MRIKNFIIKHFKIPVRINIKWDRCNKSYLLWTGRKQSWTYLYKDFKSLKVGLYNTIVDLGERPFNLICNKRILNRLFEPDRDKFDI